jgi:16S rRNA (guanine527-N7)-methyltransferase
VTESLARLAELAGRHRLPAAAPAQLDTFLRLLAHEPAAVTAVRDPEEAVDRHVADSLVALELGEVRAADTIADIGSGGGFPGVALAAALPQARVALVESVARKCAFLRGAVAEAGLANVTVVQCRAEDWEEGLERQQLVTARALASLATVVEYAAPLLQIGGVLVAWKGDPDPGEQADGAAAAAQLGMRLDRVERVQPFAGADRRRLFVYRKVAPTPAGFPRRAGMARKRPLTASSTA